MHSKEELANMPLSFFENDGFSDQSLITDIKLLAMEEVELVFTEPDELPEINLS